MATMRRTRLGAGSLFVFALLLLTTASLGAAPAVAGESGGSTAALRALLVTQQAKLTASDGAASDQAGWSVSLDGDTAVIGAPYDDIGANADQGSAYVFVRSAGGWTQQAKLTASDGAVGDGFGYSVAVSGDTILVSAATDDVGPFANQGSAYVFVRSGTTWSQQAQLTSPDGTAWNGFGWSVALDGDTALVGDPYHSADFVVGVGAAFVFVRSGTTWGLQQELVADDAAADDWFGDAVALEGDTALVGAVGQDVGTVSGQGSAYVFVRSGASWTQQAQVTSPSGAKDERFGDSVALSGETALVGAPYDHVGTVEDQGSAYVFVRSLPSWTLQRKLTPPTSYPKDDHFGSSVALDEDTALVGAEEDEVDLAGGTSHYAQGTASVFVRTGTTWARQATLTSSDGATLDHFGCSVALDGDNALVGAYNDNVSARADQGSAYVLVGNPPTTTATLRPAANVYGWNRTAVTVTLSAKDVFAGVASTQYRRAGVVDWTTYAAPFTVSGSGVKTYEYRSTDRDANVEATRILKVRIDTTDPATYALANVTVAYGGKGVFRLRVNDTISPKWWGFVKVFKGTTLKKTFNVPLQPTNTEVRYRFTCALPRGTYTWKVYGVDLASNKQSRIGYRTLTVR